jgi:hypothetical protein
MTVVPTRRTVIPSSTQNVHSIVDTHGTTYRGAFRPSHGTARTYLTPDKRQNKSADTNTQPTQSNTVLTVQCTCTAALFSMQGLFSMLLASSSTSRPCGTEPYSHCRHTIPGLKPGWSSPCIWYKPAWLALTGATLSRLPLHPDGPTQGMF